MKLDTLLKEDRVFTKNELISFKVETFTELDKAIAKIDSDDLLSYKEKADNLMAEREDSVYGRYVSGSIGMIRRPHEDNINMQNLLISFYENHNWTVVEFLCTKILALNENKFALRILADCYEETGRDNAKWPVYVRLVKVDFEERKITKALADHYKELGDIDNALIYYHRALTRFIAVKDKENVRNIWHILLTLQSGDFGYFLGVAEKVSVQMADHAFATELLNDLLSHVSDNLDRCIAVLKKELELNKDNTDARNAIIITFQKKYASSTRLKECLKKSGLTNPNEDVLKAIAFFETDIAFDKGSFVYQRSTNKLGVIKSIDNKQVTVSFGKELKAMSPDMAFKALSPLPKSHIRVLKACVPAKFAEKIKKDTKWALTTIMESHPGNKCSMKEMKEELEGILTPKEWDAFKKDAKRELDENPYFSAVANESETYTLRSTPITPEEKKLNLFKSEKDFYNKVRIVREFIALDYDTESESFTEMIKFFNDEIKKQKNGVNDNVLASFLLLDLLRSRDKIQTVIFETPVTFQELYAKVEDKVDTFDKINNADLKKSFLDHVIDIDKNWAEILKNCFAHYTYSYIPERLKANGQSKTFIAMLKESVDNYKDQSDVFLWNFKNATEKEWAKAGITYENLIITLLQLLDYTASCIELKKDVTENKKRNTLINQYLFTERNIYKAMEDGDEGLASRIYSIVASARQLDMGKKIEVRHFIGEKYPSFKFFDDAAPVQTDNLIPTGFLCTKKWLDIKIKEKEQIEHVELKKVADEIADARALGDLRENSEYQYGKDKQKNLNAQLRTLSDEIEKAQVITPDIVDPSKISFGCEVKLMDNTQNQEITYIILGQWESDPDQHILNFKTPLGMALMNKVVGDKLKFDINGTKYDFLVLDIKVADF